MKKKTIYDYIIYKYKYKTNIPMKGVISMNKLIAYKGFDKEMKCRRFQYEEGKEYTEDSSSICDRGFHACLNPWHVFDYYDMSSSIFHKVELSGNIDESQLSDTDTKVCSTKIKILEELSVEQMKAAGDLYIKEKYNTEIEDKFIGAAKTKKQFDTIVSKGIKVGNRILIIDGKFNKNWVCVHKTNEGSFFMCLDFLGSRRINKEFIPKFTDTELQKWLDSDVYSSLKSIVSIAPYKINDNGEEKEVNICLASKEEVCRQYIKDNFDFFKYLNTSGQFEKYMGFYFWLRSVVNSTNFLLC